MGLLYAIRSRYWPAAHLHVAFAALVPHEDDCNDDDATGLAPTQFISLDKLVPHRHFLQQLEFDVDENADIGLSYDPVWLAVLKSTDVLTSTSLSPVFMPSRHKTDERWDFRPTEKELEEIGEIFKDEYKIPNNFEMTDPPHKPGDNINMVSELYYRNSQTTHFCRKLGISDLNELLCAQDLNGIGIPFALSVNSCDSGPEKFRSENIVVLQAIELFDCVFGQSDFIIVRGSSDRLEDFPTPELTIQQMSVVSTESSTGNRSMF
ncbi:hypothetical protein AB6A40_003464 [Gnathostoma spinigerum]|uniref:Lariat debranching enzyme C-terminal domain-containing protein n=1 Tax=Gnathostoma spinigerum TaxID=75299 RepID=A0ABD6EKF8_9BILA